VVVVLVPGSLVYLWKASAVPDHVWVMRRFLVSAFPTLVLLGVGLASQLWRARFRDAHAVVTRVIAIAVAVAAVAYPLYTVIGVRSMSEKQGFLAVIDDGCHALGPRAAVVVVESKTAPLFDDWVPQALRGWCGAEVAISRGNAATSDSLARLASGWKARGRTLFVVAASSDAIRAVLPAAQLTATRTAVDSHMLQQTLTHRPRGYRAEAFSMVLASVPAG